MKKLVLFCALILFFKSSLLAGAFSLTRTDMITPTFTSLLNEEMSSINSVYSSIDTNLHTKIMLEIQKKDSLLREILKNKAVGEVLLLEIKQLNKDINSIYFLQEELSSDLLNNR